MTTFPCISINKINALLLCIVLPFKSVSITVLSGRVFYIIQVRPNLLIYLWHGNVVLHMEHQIAGEQTCFKPMKLNRVIFWYNPSVILHVTTVGTVQHLTNIYGPQRTSVRCRSEISSTLQTSCSLFLLRTRMMILFDVRQGSREV